MKPSVLALSLLVVLASCEKTVPQKTTEKPPQASSGPAADSPPQKEPPTRIDTPEELKKLQGKLPRMDPEKAKFIAVPNTPPDAKPAPKPPPAETIVKAAPAAPKDLPKAPAAPPKK